MVIGIIGENCSGKSTLAEAIQKDIHAEIVTGKDYLRMAKSKRASRQECTETCLRRWHRCWRENTVFLTEKSMTIALTA